MNFAILDGTIGKVERRESAVHVRLCHKDAWFDQKTGEWKQDETWVTVSFFGRKADAAERTLKVGAPCAMECSITAYPKEGPGSQVRLLGKSFHLIVRRDPFVGQATGQATGSDEPELEDFGE